METLTNMASAATKAILGDGNVQKEPVSGVQGNVAKGEPYDAGNLGTPDQSEVEKELTKEGTDQTTSKAPVPAPVPVETSPGKNDTQRTEHKPDNANKADPVDPVDPEVPTGPGPKPIDVVAKENQGDAGRNGQTGTQPQTQEQPSANDGPEKESKGTGQEHVRSTGFAAEGGDFDATKPGAGREADRLVEQNGGDQLNGGGRRSESTGTSEKGSSKHSKRHSLSEKIKAKLHKN